MNEHPVIILSHRYHQLLLPIREGMRNTEQYKDAVLRGKCPEEVRPEFSMNENDVLTHFAVPAGDVDVLLLSERADFEHAIQALAYRCEPTPIPDSMGASIISGLINWEKINKHMEEYAASGFSDINDEFARFTSEKANYLDTVIILSSGPYSAVPAASMGMDEAEWLEKSVTIRKYHELTHFTSVRLYPENKNALRDEVIADMIGLIAAFGRYDTHAARLFLGIEGETYRNGGRLQNYSPNDDGAAVMPCALKIIEELQAALPEKLPDDVFNILDFVEKNKIGPFYDAELGV